jgi:hypothetical protein
MLLCTSFSFSNSQFAKDINTPAERIVVPLVAVQIVKGLEFRARDNEIYMRMLTQMRKSSDPEEKLS